MVKKKDVEPERRTDFSATLNDSIICIIMAFILFVMCALFGAFG
jgi:hypothetical protein